MLSLRTPWLLALPLWALSLACGTTPSTPPADVPHDTSITDLVVAEDRTQPEDRVVAEDLTRPKDRVVIEDRFVAEDRPVPVDVVMPTDRPVIADVPADMGVAVGPYPAGPYGNREGQVLANLTWEGYFNLDGGVVSTMLPFQAFSMQTIRETGRRYALVHLSEFL